MFLLIDHLEELLTFKIIYQTDLSASWSLKMKKQWNDNVTAKAVYRILTQMNMGNSTPLIPIDMHFSEPEHIRSVTRILDMKETPEISSVLTNYLLLGWLCYVFYPPMISWVVMDCGELHSTDQTVGTFFLSPFSVFFIFCFCFLFLNACQSCF